MTPPLRYTLIYILNNLNITFKFKCIQYFLLDKGIKNGFWHAWIVGAGSMIADGILMLIVYLCLVVEQK